ncbi:MAG: hypothetical protein KIS66_10570 [Fimbriimonadaceae bacterium]|nr:hypothetical protein [Fimbriimonadaceae bacterium]
MRGPDGTHSALAVRQGDKVLVSYRGRSYILAPVVHGREAADHNGELRAPMPGQVVDVCVAEGEPVVSGQRLFVLEAMKTQQPFVAPFDGVLNKLLATVGAQVASDDLLAVIVGVPAEVEL